MQVYFVLTLSSLTHTHFSPRVASQYYKFGRQIDGTLPEKNIYFVCHGCRDGSTIRQACTENKERVASPPPAPPPHTHQILIFLQLSNY